MIIAMLAAASLSQDMVPDRSTARHLYDGCAGLLVPQASSPPAPDSAASEQAVTADVICAAYIAVQLAIHAAREAAGDSELGFCPPENVLNVDDPVPALARAYVTWFDRHPAAQNATDADATLTRALAETWPCPH